MPGEKRLAMSDKQLPIPGLESLVPDKPKTKAKPPAIRQQLTTLQRQVMAIEMDVMLLRLEVEGDNVHG